MTETFRLRKSVKYQGMAFSALFLIAVLAHVGIFLLENPAEHGFQGEHSVAIVGGMAMVVYGTMLLLSIYILSAYYVERFTISETTLAIRSMFQNQRFDISEIQSLTWKNVPRSGAIQFEISGAKARLDLNGFSRDDRLRIIRAIRDLIPESIQKDWPNFCHWVALPLRDRQPAIVRSQPTTPLITVTRKRYRWIIAYGFPLSIAIAIGLGIWLTQWGFAALPVLVISTWILLHFSTPVDSLTTVRQNASSLGGCAELIALGSMVIPLLVMVGLSFLNINKTVSNAIPLVMMAAGLISVIYLQHKDGKHQKAADEEAIKQAPELWRQPEARADH